MAKSTGRAPEYQISLPATVVLYATVRKSKRKIVKEVSMIVACGTMKRSKMVSSTAFSAFHTDRIDNRGVMARGVSAGYVGESLMKLRSV